MKPKLTFLLALTFLFLFSGSVYGEAPEVKREFYFNGNLKSEVPYKNGKKKEFYFNGNLKSEVNYKNGKPEGLETGWSSLLIYQYEGETLFQGGNFC